MLKCLVQICTLLRTLKIAPKTKNLPFFFKFHKSYKFSNEEFACFCRHSTVLKKIKICPKWSEHTFVDTPLHSKLQEAAKINDEGWCILEFFIHDWINIMIFKFARFCQQCLCTALQVTKICKNVLNV